MKAKSAMNKQMWNVEERVKRVKLKQLTERAALRETQMCRERSKLCGNPVDESDWSSCFSTELDDVKRGPIAR